MTHSKMQMAFFNGIDILRSTYSTPFPPNWRGNKRFVNGHPKYELPIRSGSLMKYTTQAEIADQAFNRCV